jgi:hypothetical protein
MGPVNRCVRIQSTRFSAIAGAFSLLIALLTGCAGAVSTAVPTMTPTATASPTLTASPTVAVTFTPTWCPWSWSYPHSSPRFAAEVRTTLQSAGFKDAIIFATASGETGGPDCSFHEAYLSGLDVTISDPTVTDDEGLGRLAAHVLSVLPKYESLTLRGRFDPQYRQGRSK